MTPTDPFHGGAYDDPSALRALIDEHTPRLLRKAFALCGDADQADDIVQATWVQAHFKRTSFQGRGTFAAWIDTILRHTYINQRRAQRRREQYEQSSFDDPASELAVSPLTPLPTLPDNEVQVGRLVRAILQLSPRERQVFIQRAIVGHSVREVATQIDRAEGTVKSTYAHAVTRLRELLRNDDPDPA
jgi:RNA polymerase sigma factor (sigma-70 family)